MPHTGEKCQTSGIYKGTCTTNGGHVKQDSLSVGETFPPCNTATCKGSVTWTLVQATK
jgi:hypothetical protein